MKKLTVSTLMVLAAAFTSHAVSIWSEDFEGATLGATSGNNQTLAGTVIQTANTASSIVVDASTDPSAASAFTLASGQFIRLSTGANAFTAIRSSANPITFAQVPDTTAYSISFDIYIPANLAVAVGDFQPRFKLNGVGGNGPTDTSGAQSAAGQYHISYSGTIADFISGDVNEARPFIGIDQGGAIVSDYLYMDNISFDVAIPEPSTFTLLGLGLAGLSFARRRRAG